jgi:hypothetical protein
LTLSGAKLRVKCLGDLPIATYVAILVRNDLLRPHLNSVFEPSDTGEKRIDLPLSLPVRLRRAGSKRAFQLNLNFSRYVEALIRVDLRALDAPLLIYPEVTR